MAEKNEKQLEAEYDKYYNSALDEAMISGDKVLTFKEWYAWRYGTKEAQP